MRGGQFALRNFKGGQFRPINCKGGGSIKMPKKRCNEKKLRKTEGEGSKKMPYISYRYEESKDFQVPKLFNILPAPIYGTASLSLIIPRSLLFWDFGRNLAKLVKLNSMITKNFGT